MSTRNLLAISLTLLTGLIVGQILMPSLDFRSVPSARERSAQAAAVAFYDAANRYLEFGDSAVLESTLDPGFVDHSSTRGESDTSGLLRYLAAMRATYPDTRLDVTSLTPDGDVVAVALSTTGGTAAITSGFIPETPPVSAGFEQLRIVDGKVAERWASQNLPLLVELVTAVDTIPRSGWFIQCAIDVLPLEPNASEILREPSHSLLVAGSGSLALEVDPNDAPQPLLMAWEPAGWTSVERDTMVELPRGSVIQFPEGESYRVWNPGEEPATAIVVSIQYRSPALTFYDGHSARVDPTIDDRREGPAGLLHIEAPPAHPYVFSLIRVEAAPNEFLPVHTTNGLEQVLVAQGSLEVVSYSGIVSTFGPGGRTPLVPGDRRTLAPGEGSATSGETLLSYRVAGDAPATLWFATLTPVALASE